MASRCMPIWSPLSEILTFCVYLRKIALGGRIVEKSIQGPSLHVDVRIDTFKE
jgi:hypothetical protein